MFLFFLQGAINMVLIMFAKGVAKFVVFNHLDLRAYDSNKLINGGMEPTFTEFTFTTSLLLVVAYFVVLLVASSALFQNVTYYNKRNPCKTGILLHKFHLDCNLKNSDMVF